MMQKFVSAIGVLALLVALGACHNKKVTNPIADVNSKQPDKVLFDRAMDAMKHNKFDVARLTLQTLINTYPDSEYIARAKLAVGDSWYAEGGTAALTQAENEYKDFETFFPNMPEAAEAQLKIANIHYREMEKPDRDFTHAKRAEDEYRQLIQQYPDSKLVPEAKQRLMEVQEVLAEREFRIGRFYFNRESYPAAEARLKSLVDTYPLYSHADEALFLLGSAYQRQVETVRAARGVAENLKGQFIHQLEDQAAEAYSRILTRYPVMERAPDARARLQEMKRPVPTPTPEAIAQNQKEQESRSETGMFGKVMGNFRKGPDVAHSAKYGEPTLDDPRPVSAPEIVRHNQDLIRQSAGQGAQGTSAISGEVVKQGAPPPNQEPPRSASNAPGEKDSGIPELTPMPDPNAPATTNESSSNTPPPQVNEAAQPADAQSSSSSASSTSAAASSSSAGQSSSAAPPADEKNSSTSKIKKKKGLKKLNPF
ncbi:MAG TPA: outer membrane protein assembly factor BamD [Terriglobales bacterium]|nr:outer membrane protein assembly factor BamD [Terriglobales bacterium]